MKKYVLIFTILSSFVFAPTGAFAKDKRKKGESESDKQARMEADRRANGYYAPRYYGHDRSCDHDRGSSHRSSYDDRRSRSPRYSGYRGY